MFFDFDLVVFDLDNTLWDGNELFPDTIPILNLLADNNIPIYLASFNLEAYDVCRKLGIDHYFDQIIYGRNKTKLQMINDVVNLYDDIPHEKVAFYDDDIANIEDVMNNSSVQAYYVTQGVQLYMFMPDVFPEFFSEESVVKLF